MKLTDLKTSERVLAAELGDPDFKREWDRTALGRAVALKVLAYRTEHALSRRDLAKRGESFILRLVHPRL